MALFAHSKSDSLGRFLPDAEWEPLLTEDCPTLRGGVCEKCEALDPQHGHINKVAFLCAKFASQMFESKAGNPEEAAAADNWGRLAGLWHDLGKFSPEWQAYLKSKCDPHKDEVSAKVDHSSAGAQHASRNDALLGVILSYVIAGHHAGLADGISASNSCLQNRLKKRIPDLGFVPEKLLNPDISLRPLPFSIETGRSLGFFARMLFSCLVDADFLATEAFMSPGRYRARQTRQPTIAELEVTLGDYLESFLKNSSLSPVNRARALVLESCLSAAEHSPGLFSLTVPTGGGKTLSSLAFALKHARIHGLKRIIYVIPFTSIIEQNAAVFRKAFARLGQDIVLEHHSNFDQEANDETGSNRLAAENWDARLIVTTNVQFFESLHSNRTSKCRKLHRLAGSVIILDEAQSLSVDMLDPSLKVLEELASNYGSTVVLCTATQPAIIKRPEFQIGLDAPREIIEEPLRLYSDLKRVSARMLPGKISDDELIEKLKCHDQVLCIVNTRGHARRLFELLPDNGSRFHLSALMCPDHRSAIFTEIRERLNIGLSVRLISTQLIEAGVDIDFPVVYRALAGLDSIAQAAGRCDREGHLTERTGHPAGEFYIFKPEKLPPTGQIRSAADSAWETLAEGSSDPLHLDCIQRFFKTHYWKHTAETDKAAIAECFPKYLKKEDDLLCFLFSRCGNTFKLIDDYSDPVIIPHGERGERLCQELASTFDPGQQRILARKLQRFTVSIPKEKRSRLIAANVLKPVHDGQYFILNSTCHYDANLGLLQDAEIELRGIQSII